MPGYRQERVRQRILEIVTLVLEREVQDPRLANAIVTRVEVSGDLRYAKIFVSARPDDGETEEMMDGLARAARFFRRRLAESLDMRFAPEIRFQPDYSIAKGERFLQILEQIQEEERTKQANDQGTKETRADRPAKRVTRRLRK